MEVAQRHKDSLDRIKNSVRRSYDYFKPNYDRFNEFRKFIYDTSLSSDDLTLLLTIGRPQLEFNVLEAYISRLLGEFSKQEPDIEVASDDESQADPLTVKFVQEHLRHVLLDNKNHHVRYEVYKDLLSGGFSTLRIKTDYANPMSFDQVISIERCFDPTLCGFDQLSRYSHKGDGRFCFELFPKSREEFEAEFPEIPVSSLNFRRDFAGFSWSYLNGKEQIIIVADYFEKKKREKTIVKLNNGRVMTTENYRKMVDEWDDITVPPQVVGKPRRTTIENICRYRLIENQVIEYEETDFTHFPLIFVDGNSAYIRTPKTGDIRQMTRPYVYQAKGAQRLKNYAGICLANELENTVQHKFMVAKEALPKEEEFLQAYKDVQKANVLVYNSVHEANPEMPISNPVREIQRVPAPPEIVQAFTGSDSLIQNVLGSYDASLGINNNQLSGIAIVEAASQSNATAMPYIVGFMHGLQRAAQVYVDLMPKYYTTPRSLPIVGPDGKRNYLRVNQQNGLPIDFDVNLLNVTVKAGASFQVQKSRTIMMVKEMMGMSPLFAQFMAEKGLPFILDNMEGKGIEELKDLVKGWTQEYEQQKQQAMQQQAQEPNAMKSQLDMAKLQQQSQANQAKFQIDMAKLQASEQKVLADLHLGQQSANVQLVKAQTEQYSKSVDLALKHRDQDHRHLKETIETHHKTKEHHKKDGRHAQNS